MNLKLFQQECAKKILIVLRDFDPKINKREVIETNILKDINKIWDEIQKPELYKDASFSKFFQYEFTTLPHKKYKAVEFEAAVVEMRKRLDETQPDYLFSHVPTAKNVPVDGLKQYCVQLWRDIESEKDLDIVNFDKFKLINFSLRKRRCLLITDVMKSKNRFLMSLKTN